MKRITVTLDAATVDQLSQIVHRLDDRMGHIGQSQVVRMAIRLMYDHMAEKPSQPPREEQGE